MSLGRRIAEKRQERGISQEAFGSLIRVSAAFISQVEKGKRNPSYGLLQKIAAELDVPLEYLVGSEEQTLEDPGTKLIASLTRSLDRNQKKQVLDYIHFITGTRRYYDFPFLNSATEYAQYLLRHYRMDEPPIDPFVLAEQMSVDIIVSKEELAYEGILYQGGEKPVIVLGEGRPTRQKFTVAMFIGHLSIPWHIKSVFHRESSARSLDIEDKFAIEAREFAGELLVPTGLLKRDFKSVEPGISAFEQLANERYGSSLLVIGQKYQQSHSKSSAFLTSRGMTVTRSYDAGLSFSLTKQLREGSLAYDLATKHPQQKELKKGYVPTETWIENNQKSTMIYEESMYDPESGYITTFLQFA